MAFLSYWGCLHTYQVENCSANAKYQLAPLMEQLVGRQAQPRGAQVHAMYPSDEEVEPGSSPCQTSFKGWQQSGGDLAGDPSVAETFQR